MLSDSLKRRTLKLAPLNGSEWMFRLTVVYAGVGAPKSRSVLMRVELTELVMAIL